MSEKLINFTPLQLECLAEAHAIDRKEEWERSLDMTQLPRFLIRKDSRFQVQLNHILHLHGCKPDTLVMKINDKDKFFGYYAEVLDPEYIIDYQI